MIQAWSIVLVLLVTVSVVSIVIRTLRNGVPPMPSSARVQARLAGLVRRLRLPEHGTVLELGSGWGNLSVALSQAMPTATVVGYENSPVPFWFSLVTRLVFRRRNLRLMRRNFLSVPLHDADVVVCYLSPEAMARLQPKFSAELKASAVVISSTFALPLWKATQVEEVDDFYRTRIYVYPVAHCRGDGRGTHVDITDSGDGQSS